MTSQWVIHVHDCLLSCSNIPAGLQTWLPASHLLSSKPLARNNFLRVLESWVTLLFQLGAASGSDGHDGRYCGSIYFRRNCTVTIGSAVVSVQLDCDCDFLHLPRVNWSVTCFKKAFIVVLLDETFYLTRRLRFRSYFVMLAIRLRG